MISIILLEGLQFNVGMAGKKRLLRADSDGWGVSGAIGLVLSIRCISLTRPAAL